jgi:hypothetical protein
MSHLQNYSIKITALATLRNTLIAAGIWLVFQVVLGYLSTQISNPPHILDLSLAYSPEAAYTDFLDTYTDAGRAFYKNAVLVDLFYPVAYAFLFGFLLSFALHNTRFTVCNLLPFFAAFFDYFENLGIFKMLASYPEKLYFWAAWSSVFGGIKWSFIALSVAFMLFFGIKKILKRA